MIGQYLAEIKIWNLRVQKNINIEKIAFKVVQIKFLSFDIVTVVHLHNIFMEHDICLIS